MSRRQFLLNVTQAMAAVGLPAWASSSLAAEEALSAKHLTLGCSIALSGPLGIAGSEQVAGMKAAFAEVNAAGGIHGREIRLDVKDDGYVPSRTAQNVTAMLETQFDFAFGHRQHCRHPADGGVQRYSHRGPRDRCHVAAYG